MDIRCRIGQSKQTFMDMKNVLCPRSLGLGVRKRFLKCYIWQFYCMDARVVDNK